MCVDKLMYFFINHHHWFLKINRTDFLKLSSLYFLNCWSTKGLINQEEQLIEKKEK